MEAATIDHSALSRLVRAGAVRDTRVVVREGGWAVVVHSTEGDSPREGDDDVAYTLTTHRKGARLFKKMDSLITYLTGIGISHFQVDAGDYAPGKVHTWSRPDRTAALKQTYEAAEHDKWFREQVEESLRRADSPDAVWISNEDVKARRAKRRAEIAAQLAGDQA